MMDWPWCLTIMVLQKMLRVVSKIEEPEAEMNLFPIVIIPSPVDTLARERNLFDNVPASHTNDPITSFVAEDNITESGKRESHAKQVYEGLKRHSGVTNAELATIIGLTYSQVEKRMSDLKNRGDVVISGTRYCAVNRTMCSTWRVNNGTNKR